MLHVICTQLRQGHLSVLAGDCSWRSEEIEKKNRIAPLNAIIVIYYYYVFVDALSEYLGLRAFNKPSLGLSYSYLPLTS